MPLGCTASSDVLGHHASAASCEGCTRSGKTLPSSALATFSRQVDGDSFQRAFDSFCVATGSTVRDLILQAAAPCAPKASPSNQSRCPAGRATPRFRDRAGYVQDFRRSRSARVSLALGLFVFDCYPPLLYGAVFVWPASPTLAPTSYQFPVQSVHSRAYPTLRVSSVGLIPTSNGLVLVLR